MINFLRTIGTSIFAISVVLLFGGLLYLPFYLYQRDLKLDATYKYQIWVKGVGNYRTNSYKKDGKCLNFTTHRNEKIMVCGGDIEIKETH
jgi:hypothetical protein